MKTSHAEVLDANHAVAEVACRGSEVVVGYPITTASVMGEVGMIHVREQKL